MNKFAKLFETNGVQLLVYLGSGENAGPKLFRIFQVNGVYLSANSEWEDEVEHWDQAEKEFQAFDQKMADKFVADNKILVEGMLA